MIEDKREWMERIRNKVHTLLATLTPEDAKALRTQFLINAEDPVAADEEEALRPMARELATLKSRKS